MKTMWLLIVVLTLPSVPLEIVINSYSTKEECNTEKKRVTREMKLSYPYDSDFELVCRYVAKTI